MPATQIPLTFRLAPLPMGFVGTPQQLATAIVARLSAVSANTISFFASGSVAPTSNVGPWLKNDQTWYVWSDTLATYIPQVVEPQSLGYIFSQSAPDPTIYKVWYKLDGSNDPIGIFIYANGAWKDTYASQFAAYYTSSYIDANFYTAAETDSAISTAVGNQSRYPFSAIKLVNQSVISNDPAADLLFPTPEYDPASVYNAGTSTFTAPVNGIYNFKVSALLGLLSGAPTDITIALLLVINGGPNAAVIAINESDSDTSGRTMLASKDLTLSAGQAVTAKMAITTTGASTWEIDTNSAGNFFQGSLIQAL
jgi:hypothetical protein